MKRLFVKALLHAAVWTACMFGFFSFLTWVGFADFRSMSADEWLVIAGIMTVLTMITMPLDERWARRRDHAKRMKERGFE